ncbi:MAG TPA: hypothetical protein VMM84_17265, partial [Pyrinomonadaceae bacterium]|nr:hypothetical protein [Pyrinomonadaceae bacterium]
MMFVKFFLALLLVSSNWTLPPLPERQGLQGKLETRLESYTVIADNFPQALTKIAAEFEIPMGIEWVRTPATLRKVERTWQRSTVHQVVASLVTSQPGYDFTIRNAVAHVSYRGALTDNSSFLNQRIGKFEAKNEFVGMVSYRLRELLKPIVGTPIPGEPGVGMAGSIATGAGDQRVSFRLVNATVREILDKLSLAADFKIWIVTYREDRTLTRNGFRRVE